MRSLVLCLLRVGSSITVGSSRIGFPQMGGSVVKRETSPDGLGGARQPDGLSGEILVRQAAMNDIGLIQNMARIIWADTYAGYISQEEQTRVLAHSYSSESLMKSVNENVFLLAEVSGEAAGYIDMGRQDEVLHLHRLYVMPKFQRIGLGRRLLEEAIALAKKLSTGSFPGNDTNASPKVVVATVEEGNLKARRFYKKMGFTEEGSTTMTVQGVELPLVFIVMRLF